MTVRRLVDAIIYGPVRSRRFGFSLGINLAGKRKQCSFDCAYCFRGFNENRPNGQDIPTAAQVVEAVRQWFSENKDFHIDNLTFAGNGEPTDHPHFPEIIEAVNTVRQELKPKATLTMLSNGMGLVPRLQPHVAELRESLRVVRCCFKLDSGVKESWRSLANPMGGVELAEWLEAIELVEQKELQTMLLRGALDNTKEKELAALASCYERLAPNRVSLLTLNKKPANCNLFGLSVDEMERAGQSLRQLTGDKIPLEWVWQKPQQAERARF